MHSLADFLFSEGRLVLRPSIGALIFGVMANVCYVLGATFP